MAYDVTISGTTIAVTASQIGTQGPAGPQGDGFTGGSYDAGTGVVTFTSDDGLGFSTGDLRGADGADGVDGLTVNWVGDWALSTTYAVNDSVAHNGSSYICIQAHTSSATDEPGVGANTATYWGVLAEKGTDGTGAGTVTSIDVAGGTGIDSSGGPVTSSGTITVGLNAATVASLALADTAAQPDDVETAGLNNQTGTAYTLAIGDRGQVVGMNNAGANTVTIPTNASVAFDVGSVVTVIQVGSGVTTIEGDTGVTVNGTSGGSVDISAQYQGVSLLKVAANTWIASGAI